MKTEPQSQVRVNQQGKKGESMLGRHGQHVPRSGGWKENCMKIEHRSPGASCHAIGVMEGSTGVKQRLTQPALCGDLHCVVTVGQHQCGYEELKDEATAQSGPGESR